MFFLAVAVTPLVLVALTVAWFRRRRRLGRTGWRALLVGNVLVLATLASAAFLAFEATYRFGYDTTNSWGFGTVHERWFERHWTRNAMGARDDIEYAMARDPSRRRITFLGDSFTAGHGVPEVADRFANRLRAKHPEWQVHVLADPGADTPQTLATVRGLVRDGYELDLVVLVTCLNDVGPADPRGHEAIQSIYGELPEDGFWMRNSFAVNTLAHRLRVLSRPESAGYFEFVRDSYTGEVWAEQQRRLDALRQAVEASGGRLAVVTFPFLDVLGDDYPHRTAHATIGVHWRERGVPHLDLLATYRGLAPDDLTVNPYDAHPNERAHALAAEAIEPFLAEELSAR